MRRMFSIGKAIAVLGILLIFLMAAGVAEEVRTDASGQWKYILEDSGAMVVGYHEYPTGDLVIPGEVDGVPVTAIGDEAFSRCDALTGVIIPEGVMRIGDGAFYWCFSLTDVIIPDSVTSIGEWAFQECVSLKSVIIGGRVTSIGGFAFFACESLADVTIPGSVTSIGEMAFKDCYSLISVTIPDSVTDIGESAFASCKQLTLSVQAYSHAEQYAKDNDVPYRAAQTYSSVLAQQYSEKVTLENDHTVNIRSGPGMQHPQIGEAFPGTSFFYTGTVENGFLQILYPSTNTDSGYVTAYVMESLASVSPVSPQDTVFSSSVGDVKVKQSAKVYLDADLRIQSKGKLGDANRVPVAGVSSGGAYALLLSRTNDKGEEVLWIGFVSPDDVDRESAGSETEPARPNASGQWTYVLENGGATITGSVEEPSGDLVIPGELDGVPVTGIGEGVFCECESLRGVTFPDSITSIGEYAFLSCTELESVTLPDGLTSIGKDVFCQCTNLTYVTIPDSVTSIGDSAFMTCGDLTGVAIPNSVTSIGENAFAQCGSLAAMTIPSSVVSIAEDAFLRSENIVLTVKEGSYAEQYAKEKGIPYVVESGDSFNRIAETLIGEIRMDASGQWRYVLNAGVAMITDFSKEPRGDLVIPNELDGVPVTGIDRAAFYLCAGITGVTIPDGVTSIGYAAFTGCEDVTALALPDSLISIGDNVFEYCVSLPGVIIPEGVTSIGNYAFARCYALTSVTIPASITSIGKGAFQECENLTLLVTKGSPAERYAQDNEIPYVYADVAEEKRTDASGQWKYRLIDGDAVITGCVEAPGGELIIPGELDGHPVIGIGGWAFLHNSKVTGVIIPDGVTSIGSSAFVGCTGLTRVIIPASVTSIGSAAFMSCESLTDVVIPEGVTSIGDSAFAYCSRLSSVTIPESVTEIGSNPFPASPLKSIVVSPGNPAYELIDGVLFDKRQKKLVSYPGAREGEYVIPEDVLLIGEYAFGYCDGLTGISIPDTVTSIEEHAFRDCQNLASITIPDSVTHIGEEAFAGCSGLTTLAIPASVTALGQLVFKNCANLTLEVLENSHAWLYAIDYEIPFAAVGVARGDLAVGSQWKYILWDGEAIIDGYTRQPNDDLVIPGELDGYPVTGIGDSAFERLNITSLTIPDSVNRIGDYAFFECSWLAEVTIPASVIRMGWNPFARCGLQSIRVSPENPVYTATKGVLFDKEQKMLVAYPFGKTGEYVVPKGTLRIGESAFEWSDCITGVTIPGSVTDIGAKAFYMCQSLAYVTLSNGVAQIGDEAFYDCCSLKKLTIPGSVTSIGESAFCACGRLKTVVMEQGVVEIGDYAFEACSELTKVTIPDSVTSIGEGAFFGCESLKSVSIPQSVASIGESAFDNYHGDLTLSVIQGSFAEQYAKENEIPYVLILE